MRGSVRQPPTGSRQELALYIHIPFCQSKCRYCDFNSFAGLNDLIPAYIEALIREISIWGQICGGQAARTIYLGGGTPSLLTPDQIAAMLSVLHHNFPPTSDAEVSIEVNPSSANRQRFEVYRRSGVNRLSIGVQSFHNATLSLLGRPHSAEDAENTYHTARRTGFKNINLDLLFGLPFQDLPGWKETLEHAVALLPDHFSLYPLTLDDDTPLGNAVLTGRAPRQDPDLTADMYELAQQILDNAGYRHYEISNWALPGRECRHNIVYWRNEPYLGFGAGAHSCLPGYRFSNERAPATYVRRLSGISPIPDSLKVDGGSRLVSCVCERGAPLVEIERIDERMKLAESAMLGFRLIEGIDLPEFKFAHGVSLEAAYGNEIKELEELGLLERVGSRVRLSHQGRFLGNEVFRRFLSIPDR